MKKWVTLILMGLLGCSETNIQLPNQTLEGKIGGQDWKYTIANAYRASSSGEYRIRFLSTDEAVSGDACSITLPSKDHLSITMVPRIGSYSIPLPDSFQPTIFHFSDGSQLRATNGFLEIFNLERNFMRGYLQAALDEENIIEGAFEVEFCN